MRRTTVALIVMTLAVLGQTEVAYAAKSLLPPLPPSPIPAQISPPAPIPPPIGAVGSGTGVAPGTPVFVRLSPDNNVISAVSTAAARVGLGPVSVDHFRADCSAIQGQVVVCRDINLIQAGQRSATVVGIGWCVVSLDPRVGGAAPGVNQVTRAMKKCLGNGSRSPLPVLPFGSEV
ncbi:MAG TPA: hypothetical protein VFA83_00620 [Acidimicrobiales bacterium]|nr:hypothetical protein [Acidimicrobiales bacterium]